MPRDNAPTIDYSAPPPALAHHVSALYQLRLDADSYDETETADRPQLRVMIAGAGMYHFADGRVEPTFPITLIGPQSGPVRGVGTGPMLVVGAGLMPPAWAAMVGGNAATWTDRTIDGGALLGAEARALLAGLTQDSSVETRFARLCDFLERMTAGASSAGQIAFTAIVDAWLQDNADPQMEDLLARSRLGIRQVERLAKRYYGLPPKTLARRYRAVRAAAALARGETLEANGLGDSFYDQSHLIREIKHFTGKTPEQLRGRQHSLQTQVSVGLKSLEGQVLPLISEA